jgi:hypothetical protein
MGLGKRGDFESTSPRSLDELAQLRTHTAHYSSVMNCTFVGQFIACRLRACALLFFVLRRVPSVGRMVRTISDEYRGQAATGTEEGAHHLCAGVARDRIIADVEGDPAAEPDRSRVSQPSSKRNSSRRRPENIHFSPAGTSTEPVSFAVSNHRVNLTESRFCDNLN